jgi:Uma2 family endonuclease
MIRPRDAAEAIDAEAFARFLERPENAGRRFELLSGAIIAMPGNLRASELAIFIAAALLAWVRPRNLGYITGADGGFQVAEDTVLAPDVAFIARERTPSLSWHGFGQIAPDLAVEIVSPTDRQRDIRHKLAIYAALGVLVWLVYPDRAVIEVYAPDRPVEIVGQDGVLDGGDVLPGFTLPVRDLFTP